MLSERSVCSSKKLQLRWQKYYIIITSTGRIFLVLFEQAIAYGDPGRILRVLKYWCCFAEKPVDNHRKTLSRENGKLTTENVTRELNRYDVDSKGENKLRQEWKRESKGSERKEKEEIIYMSSSLNMNLVQTSTNRAVRPSLTLSPPHGKN
jgi:hypothetical protein